MKVTQLKDRELWYDGASTFPHDAVMNLLNLGHLSNDICVKELTADIRQFNKLCRTDQQIKIKTECDPVVFEWVIPEHYRTLDLRQNIDDLAVHYCDTNNIVSEDSILRVLTRIDEEYTLYEKTDTTDVLRTMLYIVDELRANNIIWGVGRGSSVSSFILYLIGVHDVDSLLYNLDITDFFT